MNNKIVILTIIFASFIFGLFIFMHKKENSQSTVIGISREEKIKVAACPTCFEMVEGLNTKKYEVIKTDSTAESLALLESQKVDMILAGRTLKPDEPQMEHLMIEDGYSFLSNEEVAIYIDQLKDYTVYTDLNVETVKKAFSIENVEHVNNVYQYLDKGVVITSWENTDYTKAGLVHVLEKNGERVKLSRRLTLYCPDKCDKNAEELALLLR